MFSPSPRFRPRSVQAHYARTLPLRRLKPIRTISRHVISLASTDIRIVFLALFVDAAARFRKSLVHETSRWTVDRQPAATAARQLRTHNNLTLTPTTHRSITLNIHLSCSYASSTPLPHDMVNWESKADRGGRPPQRGRGQRASDRHAKTDPHRETTPR